MRSWAWQVALDPRTYVAAGLLLIVVLYLNFPLSRRLRTSPLVAAGLLSAGAVVVLLTLLPAPGHRVSRPSVARLDECVESLTSPTGLWYGLTATTDLGERVGNFLMFLPLAFFAVLAVRRPLAVALVVCLAVPFAVETAQSALDSGRECVGYDLVNNALGAVAGAVLGAVALRLSRNRISARRD